MFGDIILGYYVYAPGTLVIKGLEGFVVGLMFKKLKATINLENAKSGKSTINILISGFVIASVLSCTGALVANYEGEDQEILEDRLKGLGYL